MIGALAALVALAAPPPEPTLIYPLDRAPQVSSTFGTFRIGHHHAGLDLTTDDDESIRVLAAADGEVYRIRRNHTGFGRAVYVRHPDGRQTVYAHLSAFAPKLLPAVRRAAEKTGGFYVNARVRPIPVKAGEALGWVGTSGTDLVHLHFELRGEHGQPINPLTNGLVLPDTKRPILARLLLSPRDHDAHVEGSHDEAIYELATLKAPIELGGDVAPLLEVNDHIDGGPRDLTPHQISLSVDGRLWHRTRYDLTSYAEKGLTELDFDPRRRNHGEGVFNKLYQDGPRLPYHAKPGRTLDRLKPGPHTLTLEAVDAFGNVSTQDVPIVVKRKPVGPCLWRRSRLPGWKRPAPAPEDRVWRRDLLVVPTPNLCARGGAFVDVRVDGKRSSHFRVTRLAGRPSVALDVDTKRDHDIRIGWRAGDATPVWYQVQSQAVKPGAEIDHGPFRLVVGEKALFFDVPTEVVERPNPGAPGLTPVTPLYVPANGWTPAYGASRAGLRPPPKAPGDRVALFLHDAGRWWVIGKGFRDGYMGGDTVHFTGYALMRDTTPPVIEDAKVEHHPFSPRLIVPIREEGSGARRPTLRVDGAEVAAEWQHAFKRIVWLPLDPVKKGERTVEVTVEDRAGNKATRKQTVRWP